MVARVWDEVGASFERFCLTAGVSSLRQMMAEGAAEVVSGGRYEHAADMRGFRRGKTKGTAGFRGGKMEVERPAPLRRRYRSID